MKKNIFVLALLVITLFPSLSSHAAEIEVELIDLSCNKSMNKELSCQDRDGYAVLLDMNTIVLQGVSFVCGMAPEPAVTKATAIVSGGLGLVTAFASFLVRNMPCRQSGTYPPNSVDQREFVKAVCAAIQKSYDQRTNTCVQ